MALEAVGSSPIIHPYFIISNDQIYIDFINRIKAEDEGFEPPRPFGRRFSRPLPYQLGLVLRIIRFSNQADILIGAGKHNLTDIPRQANKRTE